MNSTIATDGGSGKPERPPHNGKFGGLTGDPAMLPAQLEQEARSLLLRARRTLLECLLESGSRTVTVDRVRDRLGLTISVNSMWLRAMPGALRAAGIIRHGGYMETPRHLADCRPISIWVLTDNGEDLARRWLRDNPLPGSESLEGAPPALGDSRKDAVDAPPADPLDSMLPPPGPLWTWRKSD